MTGEKPVPAAPVSVTAAMGTFAVVGDSMMTLRTTTDGCGQAWAERLWQEVGFYGP